MTDEREVPVNIPMLARVEGEGALHLQVRDGKITSIKLQIFEPPRLFEKFLQGRHFTEVPDLVARICGICPVAYQMSAVQALEQLAGFSPDPGLHALRRLFYCGEWIESHSLHIHLLAAPDFLGFDSVTTMAQQFPEQVRRGLRLQALGNELIALLGGRSVNPVGVCVGGFHRAPSVAQVAQLQTRVDAALGDAEALIDWCACLQRPHSDQRFVSVAMRHTDEYPMNVGRVRSDAGLDISAAEFAEHFEEHQVPYSTAFHALLDGQPYLVGPLARLNLNHDRLPARIRALLERHKIVLPSRNMFDSIVARAVEIFLALSDAATILKNYHVPERPYVPLDLKAGTGSGCTEAPRGILWHQYQVNADGLIERATIIPPTSQNQARIEDDLQQALQAYGLQRDEAALRAHGEQVIRNYDPCISCATHFLKLDIQHQ
jgi:coenzyme F420-reducing hydrogenase alpha subunit